MADSKKISVIVPVYKVEKYLRKCLDSLICQTYENLEIIVVDDGSPDECGNICDEYARLDERIIVIHKENGGLSDARNVGIKASSGRYLGFVDSDDYVEPTMFQDMFNLIEDNGVDACITNFYLVNGDDVSVKNPTYIDDKIVDSKEVLKELLVDKGVQSYAWNKLYKRELFDGIEYPVGKKYEDIGTTFYVLEKCGKIVISSKPYYYYVNREDSIVNVKSEKAILDYLELIDRRYDYIKFKYPDLKNFNDYYFVNILLTAFEESFMVESQSEVLKRELERYFEKSLDILAENEFEVLRLFDLKKKMKLYTLLYDKDFYRELTRRLNT